MPYIKAMIPYLLAFALLAQELTPPPAPMLEPAPSPCTPIRGYLKAKVAYYYQSSGAFREIYGSGPLPGIEGAVALWRDLFAYAGANFLSLSGHSLGNRDACHLLFIPLEIGLKFFFILSSHVDLYCGAAIAPSYAREHCDSPFVLRTRRKWGCGGAFQAGMTLLIKSNVFFDLFVDYFLVTMNFPNTAKSAGRDANFSGLAAGGSIGYRF